MAISATLAALFFNLIPASYAATPVVKIVKPSVLSVEVVGEAATIKWSSPKLPAKAYFEVELKSKGETPTVKVIRATTTSLSRVLIPYTNYSVRVKSKAIAKGAWSNSKGFTTLGSPVNNVNITETTHTLVSISWEPAVGATGYEVTLSNGVPKATQANEFTFSGLKPGVVERFSIRPISGLLKGVATPFFEFTTETTGPTNLFATLISTYSFTLNWNAMAGADSYNIYQDVTYLGNSKTTTFNVDSLAPGSTTNYAVQAVFGNAVTEASTKLEVRTVTETPVVPTISQVTSVSAIASWKINTNVSTYTVTLYDSSGTTVVATRSVNATLSSTTFTGLSPLTSYTVGIAEVYGAITTNSSPLASFTTTKTDLAGLTITNIGTTTATLNWASNPSAVTYEVFRDGTSIATAITPSTFSYNFTAMAPGVSYKLGVRATYLSGTGATLRTDLQELSFTTLTDLSKAPINATSPVVTLPYALNPIVGATLTATVGTWTAVPAVTSYTQQWQRSTDGGTSTFIDIAGATALTYVVTASDVGFPLRIRVSATNANGTGGPQASTATLAGAAGYNVTVPTVRGNYVVGQILESTDGTWSSPYTIVLSFQWKRDGVNITGAVSPTYTVVAADIGTVTTVQVTASTLQGSLAVTSPSRGTVTAVNNSALPTISGTVRVGSTLTVAQGTWLNASTITQQWQSSSDSTTWNAIAGATATTYVLTTAESGLYIRAQVFGNFTSGSTAYKTTANTAATGVVPASNVTNSVLPVVTGTMTIGQVLTASTGTWSTTGTFTYLWQISSNGTSGWATASGTATASTYTIPSVSGYLRVQVTNSISSGAISGIAYSVATSAIGTPTNTAVPSITGTLRIGSAQSVGTGSWSITPVSYAYQWQSSTNGISWINIGGWATSTYIPTFDICNAQIRVIVAAVGATDTATVTTAAVSGFLPPSAPTVLPVLNDTATVGSTFTVTPGTWPSTSSGQTYQWERSADGGASWSVISGATGTTYLTVAGDVGYRIRVRESLTTNTGSSSVYTLTSPNLNPSS